MVPLCRIPSHRSEGEPIGLLRDLEGGAALRMGTILVIRITLYSFRAALHINVTSTAMQTRM